MQSTPVFLAGTSQGQMNLEDYSLYGLKESNLTEHAYMHPLNLVVVRLGKATHLYIEAFISPKGVVCVCKLSPKEGPELALFKAT